jgi:hypothetical protein
MESDASSLQRRQYGFHGGGACCIAMQGEGVGGALIQSDGSVRVHGSWCAAQCSSLI